MFHQIIHLGASLVVWWLRLHQSNSWAEGRIQVGEQRSLMPSGEDGGKQRINFIRAVRKSWRGKCQTRKNNTGAIKQSQGLFFLKSLGNILCLMCELFFSYWNPHQAEQVNCCPQQVDPRLAGTRRLTLWPPHCLNTRHGSINTQDSTYPLQAGTHGLGGTRPMWANFPSKAVKLFLSFFFQPQFHFIFKLYKIVLVLPNIKMNPPQVYMCSPSWTLFPPPSPYHPSGSFSFRHVEWISMKFVTDAWAGDINLGVAGIQIAFNAMWL